MRRLAPLALVALPAALAACGTATVKQHSAETAIKAQLAQRGVIVHAVHCDSGVKAKAGETFGCTARNAADTKLIIDGRVTKVNGSKGRFHFEVARGIAEGPKVAAQVKAMLERRAGQRAKGMACPKEVPLPTKPSVTCRLTTLDGKVYLTKVTSDAQGNLGAQVAKQPVSP